MKQVSFFLLCMFISVSLCAQDTGIISRADTVIRKPDSLQNLHLSDTVAKAVTERPLFKLQNKLLNSDVTPVSLSVQLKKYRSKDATFYFIAAIVLLLAVFKFLYNRYFTNLFRVFFNTSLRQSQLTDQLLQAKLPSLVFNLFFIVSAGVYLYGVLLYYHLIDDKNKWIMILFSITFLGLIYLIKFGTLKFTGWVTGLSEITNTYVFIIFLINKIIGIFLVPFIVILSFSDIAIAKVAIIVSLMSIIIFLLLRFVRSYSLLQNQLKISRFHFILYIAGIEILPLLLIYKALMIYLTKNL